LFFLQNHHQPLPGWFFVAAKIVMCTWVYFLNNRERILLKILPMFFYCRLFLTSSQCWRQVAGKII